MTLPIITAADIAELAHLAPDLRFDDVERQAVLLENRTRDVNAAPGSGKTTLLTSKLLLMVRRWPHVRRGICVLSHTNVAREEVQRRLGSSVDGSRLLGYPHFIGTIHAFVNQFLALPYMRSTGLAVDVIDNDVFARRAYSMALRNGKLRVWMEMNGRVRPMVEGLVYTGPKLHVASEGGELPGPDAPTHAVLLGIKRELTAQGVFRFADMFAFAEKVLQLHPQLKDRLSRRFPLVFVDEMQDTSWAQEVLLQRLFDEQRVVFQRFGDINQRIVVDSEGAEKLTFPLEPSLPISTSVRFGPAIARAVAGVQLEGKAVQGVREDKHPPLLLLYSTEQVTDVISAFGRAVIKRFTELELRGQKVTALSTRRDGDAAESPGRSLLDYWPPYAADPGSAGSRSERFWALLADAPTAHRGKATLLDRSGDVRRAILLLLRSADSPFVAGVRDGQQLLRKLQAAGTDTTAVRRLLRDLVLSDGHASSRERRLALPSLIYPALLPLLPPGMTLEAFAGLSAFEEPEEVPAQDRKHSCCVVEHEGRAVDIDIGTVFSRKGETHLATLVMESYGGQSRRFDLKEALLVLSGHAKLPPKSRKLLQWQFRNLYVGMSRPTSLLCVAANAERVSQECRAALLAKGWEIDLLA